VINIYKYIYIFLKIVCSINFLFYIKKKKNKIKYNKKRFFKMTYFITVIKTIYTYLRKLKYYIKKGTIIG